MLRELYRSSAKCVHVGIVTKRNGIPLTGLSRPSDIDKDSEGLVELLHMAATVETPGRRARMVWYAGPSSRGTRCGVPSYHQRQSSRYRSSSCGYRRRGGRFRRGLRRRLFHRRKSEGTVVPPEARLRSRDSSGRSKEIYRNFI